MPPLTHPSIGERLREVREAKGLTRAQLAYASGTSEPAIARCELYGTDVRLSTLQAWAGVLDVPIGDLVPVAAPSGDAA